MALQNQTLKKYAEYEKTSVASVEEREIYRKLLDRLAQSDVSDNENMQAVVGFDEGDEPVFLDMTSSNLFSHSATGHDMDTLGINTILLSMILRFPKEKFS
jgi:hypothetical protein